MKKKVKVQGLERERERIPFGELVTDLVTNGFDSTSGEIGLVGVETGAIG